MGFFPPLSQFFDDAAGGKLPAVAFLDLKEEGGVLGEDGHPPSDIQLAEQQVMKIVQALSQSPHWARAALFITFDEHGGLWDHVPPPTACRPDDHLPMTGSDGFDRLGIRVPLFVVSPFARPGFVSHQVHSHTSILRFIEARFGLAALSARDANASPLYELFDFAAEPKLLTPPALPPSKVDPAGLAECQRRFPPDATVNTDTGPSSDAGSDPDAGLPE
jgi:phospholipase C